MLHNVRMLQRRFPQSADRIITVVSLISLSALAAGVGLLLLG